MTEFSFIVEPPGMRVAIRRFDATDEPVRDFTNWADRDESVWLVEDALGDSPERALGTVRRSVRRWVEAARPNWSAEKAQAMTEVHLRSALDHPETPLGVVYRHPECPGALVIYRGDIFDWQRGILIPTGERDPDTPTPARWYYVNRMAELLVNSPNGREVLSAMVDAWQAGS